MDFIARSADPQKDAPASRKGTFLKLAVILVAIIALILLGKKAGPLVEQLAQWVEGIGLWGPVVFILGYAVATVAMIPGSLLTLAAGAIFGLFRGTIYVFVAATLGSCAAFLVSRYVARRAVERKLKDNTKFASIDRAIGERGLWIVILLRLSPIFPFNLLNYGLGLTKVRFIDYALASFAMIPGTLLYVYYGYAAGTVAAAAAGTEREKGPLDYALLGVGLVATIVVTALVTRVARRALKEATGDARDPTHAPAR